MCRRKASKGNKEKAGYGGNTRREHLCWLRELKEGGGGKKRGEAFAWHGGSFGV